MRGSAAEWAGGLVSPGAGGATRRAARGRRVARAGRRGSREGTPAEWRPARSAAAAAPRAAAVRAGRSAPCAGWCIGVEKARARATPPWARARAPEASRGARPPRPR
eukprot:3742827-Pleurochrysis_carterae.AAC.1